MFRKSLTACFVVLILSVSVYAAETQKEKQLIDWSQNYVEASGMAVPPTGKSGAQGKALARRGAMADLQRNMLEFIGGVQIDSRTTMDDFMAEDRVRSEVHGFISRVEIMKGEWDGESYTVTGRIKTNDLRILIERVTGITITVK